MSDPSALFQIADLPPVEWADALEWLPTLPDSCARAAIFDPPYAVGTPVRGREDGAAGSVFGPMSFMTSNLREIARVLKPGGIVLMFADWRRMPDMNYVASTVGLRPAAQVAWVRTSCGTGGLLRSAWDPIQVLARGVPDAIDHAAIPNVVHAEHPTKRKHPYQKPAEVYRHVLARVCRPGDLVIDPFAGSASSRAAALAVGATWRGCDVDPEFADAQDAA